VNAWAAVVVANHAYAVLEPKVVGTAFSTEATVEVEVERDAEARRRGRPGRRRGGIGNIGVGRGRSPDARSERTQRDERNEHG
jgi:hypothetical protein